MKAWSVSRRQRRGTITFAVLVCLVVLSLISASLLKLARAQRRAILRQESALQADSLAASGFRLALARIAADPGYKGETWTITPAALGTDGSGVVKIDVTPGKDDNQEQERRVSIRAEYRGRSGKASSEDRSHSRIERVVDVQKLFKP